MPQPLEVELVGEGCEWLLSLIGPLAIALGALGAAMLSIRFANRRHQEQLEVDRELHKERLAHDRELAGMQLEHDRRARYREHVQQTLDSVIERTQELCRSSYLHMDAVEEVEQERSEMEAELPGDIADNKQAMRRWLELQIQLLEEGSNIHRRLAEARGDSLRLRVRLGEHEIVARHEEVVDAVDALVEAQHMADERNRTPAEKAEGKKLDQEVTEKETRFLKTCASWNLTDLDPPH